MWNQFSDIAPKAVVAAVTLWSGVSYFVLAPEIGSRVVRVDFLSACEENYKTYAAKAAEKRLADLPSPGLDAGKEMSARQLRGILDNPILGQLDSLNIPGLTGMADARLILQQYEEQKQAAVEAYKDTVERLKHDTATDLGKSGSVCGCIGDIAINETQTDWALFSGTLGVIRPASLKAFDERMERIAASGKCGGKAGG